MSWGKSKRGNVLSYSFHIQLESALQQLLQAQYAINKSFKAIVKLQLDGDCRSINPGEKEKMMTSAVQLLAVMAHPSFPFRRMEQRPSMQEEVQPQNCSQQREERKSILNCIQGFI